MNKVFLHGKIVNDPLIRSKGAPCEITVLTRDEWKGEKIEGKNNSEFHNVVIWGNKGDWVFENLKKGDSVLIEGFLKHNKVQYPLKNDKGEIVKIDNKEIIIKKINTEIKVKTIKKV